jgi:hypothetical protein
VVLPFGSVKIYTEWPRLTELSFTTAGRNWL